MRDSRTAGSKRPRSLILPRPLLAFTEGLRDRCRRHLLPAAVLIDRAFGAGNGGIARGPDPARVGASRPGQCRLDRSGLSTEMRTGQRSGSSHAKKSSANRVRAMNRTVHAPVSRVWFLSRPFSRKWPLCWCHGFRCGSGRDAVMQTGCRSASADECHGRSSFLRTIASHHVTAGFRNGVRRVPIHIPYHPRRVKSIRHGGIVACPAVDARSVVPAEQTVCVVQEGTPGDSPLESPALCKQEADLAECLSRVVHVGGSCSLTRRKLASGRRPLTSCVTGRRRGGLATEQSIGPTSPQRLLVGPGWPHVRVVPRWCWGVHQGNRMDALA